MFQECVLKNQRRTTAESCVCWETGRDGKAKNRSSARQSWAETQGISEQMASWSLTVRPRDLVSLRNTASTSELWGISLTHAYSNSLTYQTILHPSSALNKHLGILILIVIRKRLTNEVTAWPSVTLVQVTMSIQIRVRIHSGVCCKCLLMANSCGLGSASQEGPVGVLSGAAGWR